jgi:hypothetical protein
MNAKEYRGRQWQILLFGDQPIRDIAILHPMAQKKKPRYRKQYRGQVNQCSGIDCITQKAKPPALLHAGGLDGGRC